MPMTTYEIPQTEFYNFAQSVGENIYFVESIGLKSIRSFSENIYFVESISSQASKAPVSENLYLVESQTTKPKKVFSEPVYLTEAAIQMMAFAASLENLYLAEGTTKRVVPASVSELLFLAEAMSMVHNTGGTVYTQTFLENLYFVEAFSKLLSAARSYSENGYLNETMEKRIQSGDSQEKVYLTETFNYVRPTGFRFNEEFFAEETFYIEHFAETISSYERPYLTEIKRIPDMSEIRTQPKMVSTNPKAPVMRAVRGFQEAGG